jgi:hypothetical protein
MEIIHKDSQIRRIGTACGVYALRNQASEPLADKQNGTECLSQLARRSRIYSEARSDPPLPSRLPVAEGITHKSSLI